MCQSSIQREHYIFSRDAVHREQQQNYVTFFAYRIFAQAAYIGRSPTNLDAQEINTEKNRRK